VVLNRLLKRHHMNMLHMVLGMVVVTWLGFQLFVPASEQPTILTNALQVAFGAWLADIAYDQRTRDEKVIDRVDKLERSDTKTVDRVGDLENAGQSEHGRLDHRIDDLTEIATHDDDAAQTPHHHEKYEAGQFDDDA
jgi:hypothetical protein